jgi:protein-tyrosine phosphatase
MHAIISQKLWIGNARDGRDTRMLFENQIGAVVDLAAEEPPAQLPRELIYFRIPLLDGSGNAPDRLKIAVIVVAAHLLSGVPQLVCCGAGLSRSPAIASFAMAQWNDKLPRECLQEIQSGKPVDVSPALWNDIEQAAHPVNWRMV